MTDIREGSDSELKSMMYGVDLPMPVDPRHDRAFALMRGEPDKTANVVALVPSAPVKSDDERAAEYKAALRAPAEELCRILTAARRDGFILSWQAGWDVSGRAFVQSIDAMKPF